jgi:ribosomal protein S18 acetylase RimI-like enzyme|tara:strand:+ start:16 stop:519 length:504 start_codon:yes stop_codon:yes gene_type:complete
VTEKIFRNYLEINNRADFKMVERPSENYSVKIADPKDFQLNKFFYKNIGKSYQWVDRLVWTDLKWIDYVSNENLFTYILKDQEDIAGYFELLLNPNNNDAEIAYFGLLEEYFGKKLGGYLLSEAIKQSFRMKSLRVWVHTCSLDHQNALGNYLSRGMKIFKSETLIR